MQASEDTGGWRKKKVEGYLTSKSSVFAKDCEQGALRKQCQTCVDLSVNRFISKIPLWRCKTSVFLNRERKNPTTFPRKLA